MEDQLYPTVYNDSSLGYNNPITRDGALNKDLTFNNIIYALLNAFGADRSYSYLFDGGFSLHEEQLPWTFYNDVPTNNSYGEGLVNGSIADSWMEYISAYVATGDPNGGSRPYLPTFGSNSTVLSVINTTIGPESVPFNEERVSFWLSETFF